MATDTATSVLRLASVDGPRLPMNGFLLREDIENPFRVISDGYSSAATYFRWTGGELVSADQDTEPGDRSVDEVLLAVLSRPVAGQPWQDVTMAAFGLPPFRATSQSAGLVVFCQVEEGQADTLVRRWLAWTFGAGSRAVRRHTTDPRFGLVAALNCITQAPPSGTAGFGGGGLQNIGYRAMNPFIVASEHRASENLPVDAFAGFDRNNDLVSSVGGKTGLPELHDVLGGRSFRFRAHVSTPDDFPVVSTYALQRFRETDYRTGGFSFIDNTVPVYDEDTFEALVRTLAEQLLQEHLPSSIDALLADDLIRRPSDEDRTVEYVLFPNERKEKRSRTVLTIGGLHGWLRKKAAGSKEKVRSCLREELRFLDGAGELLAKSPILNCLNAELHLDGEEYLVYDGDFYRVEQSYIDNVNTEIRNIATASLDLPTYGGRGEPAFNNLCRGHKPGYLLVLDRELVRIPGETTFEACDLLTTDGHMVHVKVKGGASTLSHLLYQAENSALLLSRSPQARQELNGIISALPARADAKGWPKPTSKAVNAATGVIDKIATKPADTEVVFAILGDWKDKSLENLPLFSRVSLAGAATRIRGLGYKVSALTIGLDSAVL